MADAATYILRGVLTTGTAKGDGVTRGGIFVPQAGKTGTANSFDFAAFGGYTPKLAGYVSMFNPTGPVNHPMIGDASCYRSAGGGAGVPRVGIRRQRRADLAADLRVRRPRQLASAAFHAVPGDSGYFRAGTGQRTAARAKHKQKHH